MASTDAPAALAQKPPPGGGRLVSGCPLQVLVVDNSRPSRCSTKALLRSCGFQATAVQTAKQGLELLEAAPEAFDLILKQHDPKHRIDAARMMSRLRSSNSTSLRSLPVAVTSTCDEREAVLQCLRMGAADYLIHPLRINELLVLGTRICHSKQAICPPVLHAAQEPADWSCTSADTDIHEEVEEPEAEADQEAQRGGNVPRAGSRPDSVLAQNLCGGQASANWNSAAKAAPGCVVANDGSNAANGHGSNIVARGSSGGANGSNTGNGDSTTQSRHMSMRRLPDAAVPPSLQPPATAGGSGSGYRTGSGNSRDDGGANGSKQGSRSGNEVLARTQPRASEPQQLWAQLGVTIATAAHVDDSSGKREADATKARGSNGSGVGDAEGDAVAAAKGQAHAASTHGRAQGKWEASIVPDPEAPATAAPSSQQLGGGGGRSPRAPDESQQAALPQSGSQRDSVTAGGVLPRPASASPVGFRAWVGQPHHPPIQDAPAQDTPAPARHHCGLKRKAGSASLRGVGPPMAGSRRVAGKTSLPANSCALEHFSSANTGGSSGTCARLGSGGLPGGSSVRQGSALHPSSVAASAAASQPSEALPPLPWLLEHRPTQHPQGQPSSTLDSGTSAAPQLLKQHGSQGNGQRHHHHQEQPQPVPQPHPQPVPTVPCGDASASAWDSANGASALTLQQLQLMHTEAAAQQQRQAANQQQSQAHQEEQGTAEQQSQQAQLNTQMHRSYDSNFQCGGVPPHMVPHNFAPAPFGAWGSYATAAQQAGMQQQQLLAFAQQMHQQGHNQGSAQQQAQMQHAHAQQMMMASYPAFLLGGQFGMGGCVATPSPGGFGNFQAGWAQAQQQQQAQLQQQLQQTATAPAATGGGSQARQQRHHTAASSPFANGSQAAGTPGHPGMVQPSAVVGDSELGDAVNGTAPPPSSCTGLTRQPTPRECRAQALTKYKEKRKNLRFTKKIRYENRKQLAQARPRLRGQFVRMDDAGAGAAVEVLDGGDAPSSAAALDAAVAAGTARLVPEEEAAAAGLATVGDDGAESEASDVASPRAAPCSGIAACS